MALYRVIRSLVGPDHDRIKRGTVLSLYWGRGRINALVGVGAISRVSSPPLSELPGWEQRAKTLAVMGVNTAEDFVEFDDTEILRKCLGIRKSEEVQHLKEQVLTWLQPSKPKGPCRSC